MLTKEQIRSKILHRLKIQKEEERDRKSRIVKEKLLGTLAFKKAKILMFYISFDGEVKTEEMIKEARNLGKIITVPVCRQNRAILRPCILGYNAQLLKGPYGVNEPLEKRFMQAENLDLVVVPGVAFDKEGNRLGRGKGCYDRFLKNIPAHTKSIGLAFDFQILPVLPANQHDVAVDKVIFA